MGSWKSSFGLGILTAFCLLVFGVRAAELLTEEVSVREDRVWIEKQTGAGLGAGEELGGKSRMEVDGLQKGAEEMSAKKVTFEQQLQRLEEIVAALEKGDVQLADSLSLFEEGTKLIAACSKQLDQAEQQVVKLMKGPDGVPMELPFENGEE